MLDGDLDLPRRGKRNSMRPSPNYFGQLFFSLQVAVHSVIQCITNVTDSRSPVAVPSKKLAYLLRFASLEAVRGSCGEWCENVVKLTFVSVIYSL